MATLRTLVHIDPDGDLWLRVGSGQSAVTYIVCSKTLARSSRFFKQLLYGEFAESKKNYIPEGNSNWTVVLPEDNPEAMNTVLRILHAKFDDIPETISVMDLYELTVLTDKYDLAYLLRPWAKGWAAHIAGINGSIPMRIWIAWELGYEDLFEKLVKHLVLNLNAIEIAEEKPWDDATLQPPGLYDFIQLARFQRIFELLSGVTQLLESLADAECRACRMQSERCTASMLETMTKSLERPELLLWPLPNIDEVLQSVASLGFGLYKMNIKSSGDNHVCDGALYLRNHIRRTSRAKFVLPEAISRHLQAQAKKTGLSNFRGVWVRHFQFDSLN
ncbi:hypothetical protein F5Y13DRAFT_185317 [Hypoxylon sp. FL1857]|nr:hypothetical protein F5Y13DRAFT_185317 [Hypoxylon sp. FL1857]